MRASFYSYTGFIRRTSFIAACLLGASAIAFNALASHLPQKYFIQLQGRETLHLAANMALWHSLLLLILSFPPSLPALRRALSCTLFLLGILCFSFSLGLYALGAIHHALLAPFGGILLIFAWLSLLSFFPLIGREKDTAISQNKDP